MTQILRPAALVSSLLVSTALLDCSSNDERPCSNGACDPGDGTVDGGKDSGKDGSKPVPHDCVEDADTNAPETKPCMVDDFALFVDGASGKDSNDGSKAKPFKSISAAINAVASSGKHRIYICGETKFPEHVKITTDVSLFGGFACADWSYDGKKAHVAPNDKGYALEINNVSTKVVVSDLDFVAADAPAVKDGTNSIAAFISKSTALLRRSQFTAGIPADGADGEAGTSGAITMVSSGTMDAKGNSASGAASGAAKTCTCSTSSTTTQGGIGGDMARGGGTGLPLHGGSAKDGSGGAGGVTCGTGTGHDGADAPPATDAPSPITVGSIGPDGWSSQGGDSAGSGKPGQGGGGGGSFDVSNAGGGGGCGGCGGFGGKGGQSGGASIALLLNESALTLNTATMAARHGGNGGNGGPGVSGGNPGGGLCPGGAGGRGADGGKGAGGAGGLSIGILYKGTRLTEETVPTITIDEPGAKGTGGKAGVNDGKPGVAAKEQDVATL